MTMITEPTAPVAQDWTEALGHLVGTLARRLNEPGGTVGIDHQVEVITADLFGPDGVTYSLDGGSTLTIVLDREASPIAQLRAFLEQLDQHCIEGTW
jgi:hypothetical protein